MFEQYKEWLIAAAYCTFAAFAGLIGYVMRTMDDGLPLEWQAALINFFGSAFVGTLAFLLCQAMALQAEWTGVIVGVFGWLGAKVSIQMLENAVRQKLGLGDKDSEDL